MLFTTYDRDNDPWTNSRYHDNCAVYNGGGFWWASSQGYCGSCDVNAVRDVGEDFSWDLPRGQLKLQTSRMWLQCKHPYPSHVGHWWTTDPQPVYSPWLRHNPSPWLLWSWLSLQYLKDFVTLKVNTTRSRNVLSMFALKVYTIYRLALFYKLG